MLDHGDNNINYTDKRGCMMRVAAINDLSGLGKCSLVADISVFSAMGIGTCAVPTAVLSAQTGFSSYYLSPHLLKTFLTINVNGTATHVETKPKKEA